MRNSFVSGRSGISFYTNILLLKFGLIGKLQKTIYQNWNKLLKQFCIKNLGFIHKLN